MVAEIGQFVARVQQKWFHFACNTGDGKIGFSVNELSIDKDLLYAVEHFVNVGHQKYLLVSDLITLVTKTCLLDSLFIEVMAGNLPLKSVKLL